MRTWGGIDALAGLVGFLALFASRSYCARCWPWAYKGAHPHCCNLTVSDTGEPSCWVDGRSFGLCCVSHWYEELKLRFRNDEYIRLNSRRLEHLASLNLDLFNQTVLEVGAGIGDLSSFFLDRGCKMTITDGRPMNVAVLRDRFSLQSVRVLDMDDATVLRGQSPFPELFDIVFCYGLLYHLRHVEDALMFLQQQVRGFLLLETAVDFDRPNRPAHSGEREDSSNPTRALHGWIRPFGHKWLFGKLNSLFPHVYVAQRQPNHGTFPVDWTAAPHPGSRVILIASKIALNNPNLHEGLLDRHIGDLVPRVPGS